MSHMNAKRAVVFVAVIVLLGAGACKRDDERRSSRTESPEKAQQARSADNPQQGQDDQGLTTRVQAKFYGAPAIKRADVHVKTDGSVVTLEGKVPDEQVRQQAVATAQSVPGVQRVDDRLQVQSPTGSTATTGRSPTAVSQEPQAAGSQAARSPETSATPGVDEQLTDGWITVKIESQYFADPLVKADRVEVDTADGSVTLRGTLPSEESHRKALEIARQTEGVKNVRDELRVAGAHAAGTTGDHRAAAASGQATSTPDEQITTRILSKYYRNQEVRPSAIEVTTKDGLVTLTGTVASAAQREQAVILAKVTDGVRSVDDRLRVEPPLTSVGTVGSLPSAPRSPRSDYFITASVQARYFQDDELKKHNIKVDTKAGTVTLAGTVESDKVKQQAETLARSTDGVVRVVNKIVVRGESGSEQ